MDLTWIHALMLIISGLFVGFINTLAGGGTIISLSVFMFFGLPPVVANGTNRVAVLLQNMTAVINFSRKKMIDWNKALRLAIPIIPGAVLGAFLANLISNTYFNYIFGIVVIVFAILLLVKPDKWLKEQENLIRKPLRFWHYMIFFLIGIYGGFIHVAVGYMILFALIIGTGNELLKANAIKNFLVLVYIPFSLAVFAFEGNVNWTYGLIHAIGNIIGAQVGALIAIKKGAPFIRYMMLILLAVVILQLFGVLDPEAIAVWLRNK